MLTLPLHYAANRQQLQTGVHCMRVLVTGGAGFIGSHLATALVAEGAIVRVLDDLSSGNPANLEELPVELMVGDVADADMVRKAVSGCDLIFHQAALVSVPLSIKEPLSTFRTNVTGTFNLFEAARQAGIQRIIYASSSAVYGNLPGLPKREEQQLQPASPYAATKQMNEVLATAYRVTYGLELVGLRYMNVFGPRQDPSSPYSGVLSIFCQAAISGETCTIYGDGEQSRDFVYVEDVVQANLLAARVAAASLPATAVFNIGRGEQTTLNQVLDMLEELVGRPIRAHYTDERAGDIKHSVADTRRAEELLGFSPRTRVIDGLKATLAWFRAASNARR
jgi:UDP-glucose 4-epimerase